MADAGLPWSIPNAGFSIQPVNGEFAAWSKGSSVPPDGWSVLSGSWPASLSRCQGGTGPWGVDFGSAGVPSTLVSDYIVVLPNTRYLLSALYRIVSGTGAALSQGVRVDWYDDTRTLISSTNLDLVSGTSGNWTYLGVDTTSPIQAVYAKVVAGRFNVNGSSDFQVDAIKLDRAVYIPSGVISLDDVTDGTTYARPRADGLQLGYPKLDSVVDGTLFRKVGASYVDSSNRITGVLRGTSPVAGADLFAKTLDTLDNVPNGTTYSRVNTTALSSGNPKTDSLVDGTYAKVLADHLTSGAITSITRGTTRYASSTFFQKSLDNLDNVLDGASYGKVNLGSLSSGNFKTDNLVDGSFSKVAAGYVDATTKAVTTIRNTTLGVDIAGSAVFRKNTDTLDDMAEGTTYKRLVSGAVTSGYPSSVYRDGAPLATSSLFKKASDTLDSVLDGTTYSRVNTSALSAGNPKTDALVDGTYAKVLATQLTSGAITSLTRSGTSYATTTFFQKALDSLDNVLDGVSYARVNAAALTSGNPKMDSVVDGTTYGKVKIANLTSGVVSAVDYGGGATTSTANLFRKGTDTFANVAGTIATSQFGVGVVDTSALGANAVTTAKIADLAVTAAELEDGVPLSAYDEVTAAAISARSTVTNGSKTTFDGSVGCISFTASTNGVAMQVSTGLYTGTSTNLLTPLAVVRYRARGAAAIGKVTAVTAVNTANTAQTASAQAFSSDGNWYTAVFDISGWTTAGTLRVDWAFGSGGATAIIDIAYMATGNSGSGTGALVSYRGNVGIGTYAPTQTLQVNGSFGLKNATWTSNNDDIFLNTNGASTVYLRPGGAGSANWQYEASGSSPYHRWTGAGGTELARLNSTGLGINNSTPKSWLDVQNNNASGTTAAMQWWSWGVSSTPSWGLRLDQIHTGSAIDYAFRTRNGTTSDVEALYVKSDGQIGVGLTGPSYRVDIASNTAQFPQLLRVNESTHATSRRAAMRFGTGFTVGQDSAGNGTRDFFIFDDTNAAYRMYITAGGNVGIGTTSTPAEKLHVVGNIRNSVLAGTGNRTVYSDGNGTLTNTSSDATLKEEVQVLENALPVVMSMRPVSFQWKDKQRFGPYTEIGFMAQEMRELVPYVVGINFDDTLTIDYPKLVAVLARAIQELKQQVDKLANSQS